MATPIPIPRADGAYLVEPAGWCCVHGHGPEATPEDAIAVCKDCRIPLETPVLVTDEEHELYGEVGYVRNDWLATFRPDRIIYSVEFGGYFHTFSRDQLDRIDCPDCGRPWVESMWPCVCGLTIEEVVKRNQAAKR